MARRTGSRMTKQWQAIPGIYLDHTADGTLLGGAFAFSGPATVLRMLGTGAVYLSGAVATDECWVSMGIAVVSTDAYAVGASAMPEPSADPGYPWLWRMDVPLSQFNNAAVPDAGGANAVRKFDIDVKSMRRVKPSESLAFISEYLDQTGTPPATVAVGSIRILLAT